MVSFGIPLFANIHLCGSVLTEVFFCMTISKILYGHLPSIGTMLLFCALLGIFAIGVFFVFCVFVQACFCHSGREL